MDLCPVCPYRLKGSNSMSVIVLGPAVNVTIAVPPPAPVAGRIGVEFDPTSPMNSAGTVALMRLLPAVGATDNPPSLIQLVLVDTSVNPLPTGDANTPEWYLALSGAPGGSYTMPTPPPAAGVGISIPISPAPAPGAWVVQSILTYPD